MVDIVEQVEGVVAVSDRRSTTVKIWRVTFEAFVAVAVNTVLLPTACR